MKKKLPCSSINLSNGERGERVNLQERQEQREIEEEETAKERPRRSWVKKYQTELQ